MVTRGLWAYLDQVPLYEVSAAARLEAGQAPHPLEAPMDGRLLATFLEAGRSVRAGEVLVQIEAGGEVASRREAETRLASLERELLARRAELALAEPRPCCRSIGCFCPKPKPCPASSWCRCRAAAPISWWCGGVSGPGSS